MSFSYIFHKTKLITEFTQMILFKSLHPLDQCVIVVLVSSMPTQAEILLFSSKAMRDSTLQHVHSFVTQEGYKRMQTFVNKDQNKLLLLFCLVGNT